MKKLSFFLAATILVSSCASIVSTSRYPVRISSSPSEATISIQNARTGMEIYKGVSPATVMLSSGDGFFRKPTYNVIFNKDGYDQMVGQIHFSVDGWYWGNLLFGGLVGMLIIDPATGAMYRLDTPYVNANLYESSANNADSGLELYSLEDIPESWKEHLILLEE